MTASLTKTLIMHAVQYNKYGGGAAGLKHVEVPVPAPKREDEILIKVEAVSLNAVDWKVQNGVMRPLRIPRKFPYIPGTDVAGEVVEIGSGVKNFKAGDKVVAFINYINDGGLAEFTIVKERLTVARPPEVSAADAAALPVASLTAYKALQALGIKFDGSDKQTNILITAASGGVGHYAVQLAKLGNAHVTATCGARNFEFVKNLGADEVIDYKTPEGEALKSPSGKKYDAVVHCTSGIAWSTFERNLSKKGQVIDLTPGPTTFMRFGLQKLTFSNKRIAPLILTDLVSEKLECPLKLMKEGKLKTVIDSKHPLSKAQEAWTAIMSGHATGKIIIEP